MKPRTLLVLALLGLGLGAFIYFVERDMPTTDERRALDKKVLGIEAEDVTGLILRFGDTEVRLEKESPEKAAKKETPDGDDPFALANVAAAKWHLTSPFEARADSAAVDALVSRLTGLEKVRTLEDIDAEQLGLTSPRATAVLVTKKGEQTLEIGTELPLSSDLVMRTSKSGKTFQVSGAAVSGATDLVDQLTRQPGDWRDKRLFTADRADIERVTLLNGDQRLLLARRGDAETFWIESPRVDRADTQAVSGLLTTLTGLEAKSFVDQEPAGVDLGFEAPSRVVEVVVKGDETPWRLELGHAVDALSAEVFEQWARVGGHLVQLDATGLEQPLSRDPADWRSHAWSSMQVFKIDRVRYQLGPETGSADSGSSKPDSGPAGDVIDLRRETGDWLRGEDKIDYSVASDALYPLTEVRADQLLDRAAAKAAGYALDTPRLIATLTASDGGEEVLTLYPSVDGHAPALALGRDAVLLLAADSADEIVHKVETLRDAEPLQEAEPPADEDSQPSADPEAES